jgi:hypothetical protein
MNMFLAEWEEAGFHDGFGKAGEFNQKGDRFQV